MTHDNSIKEEKIEFFDRRVRKPGEFQKGFSQFTEWHNKKCDVSRYDQDVHRPLKRCLSEPPSQIDCDTTTHFGNGEGVKTDLSSKPPRSQPHLECSPGGMDVSL